MKLACIFTDHMVLQAERPIKIFGVGKGCATVNFFGEKYSVQSEENEWCITIPPMKYGGPYRMEIDLNGKKVLLRDIMIGEVWLAAGQSNMEFPLYKALDGIDDAKKCYDEQIRFFTVSRRREKNTPEYGDHFGFTPADDLPWQICEEETALTFSAIGYYVAKEIREKTGVTVGIISCNWGGSMIEAHIKRKYFYNSDTLKAIIDEYDKDEYNAEDRLIEWRKYISELNKDMLRAFSDFDSVKLVKEIGVRAAIERNLSKPLTVEHINDGPYKWQSPGLLFGGMYERIIPYGIKGMMWYQGESNRWKGYLEKYLTLMKCMRQEFQNPDMPIYAVELASFNNWAVEEECQMYDNRFVTEDIPCNWAFNREQQQEATEIAPNNYLVTSMELGDVYDIHPIYKKELAKRMAKKILKHTYGCNIEADQPVFRNATFGKNEVVIELDNAQGLYCRDLSFVKMFVSDESCELKRATVTIDGTRLILRCPEIEKPTLVRYGFDFYYDGMHIYNRAGLPLAPFRTDKPKGDAKK